jgi:streptomycin 6-kinase
VERAEGLFAELLASQAPAVVLHGDLHHMNILAAGPGDWRAIDPKGVIGEPAYECGALLRNPIPQISSWPELARTLARRIAVLAETLRLDRRRIHGWALAQTVLSAWWSVEDDPEGYTIDLAVADALVQAEGML